MKKQRNNAEASAVRARLELQKELERMHELHEPPMPSATPAIKLPDERRKQQRRSVARESGRHAGRRLVDALGKKRFIV
jgi:hypothetical protein